MRPPRRASAGQTGKRRKHRRSHLIWHRTRNCLRPRRDLAINPRFGDDYSATLQQLQFQDSGERTVGLVNDVSLDAVETFIREYHRLRLPDAPQVVVASLRYAVAVEDAPPCPRPQIA